MAKQKFSSQLNDWRCKNKNQLLLVIATLFWMGLYTYPSLFTPYLDEIGATLTQSGLILGGYGFTQMILRLPLGIWSDYLQKKKTFVIAGMTFALMSALGLILTHDIWLIFIFRAMGGVAAAFWVQISALYMNYNVNDSTMAVGHLSLVNSAAIIAATFIGGQIIARFGYPKGFGLGAVFAAIGLILCLLLPEDQAITREEIEAGLPVLEGLKLSLGDKGLIWGSLFAAVTQFLSYSGAQGFLPQYASNLGVSASRISIMVAINKVASLLAIVLASQVLLRYFRLKQILTASMLINTLLLFSIPLAKNYLTLLIIMFFLGIVSTTQMTYFMDAATSHIPSERRATGLGFFQAVYGIGMVAGPAVTGAIAELYSLSQAFVVAAFVGLVAVALMIWKLPDRAAIRK